MIMLLNLGRLLMVAWIIYGLVLLFAPHMLHRMPDPMGASLRVLVAFAVGFMIDRGIGVLRRRKAMRMAGIAPTGGSEVV